MASRRGMGTLIMVFSQIGLGVGVYLLALGFLDGVEIFTGQWWSLVIGSNLAAAAIRGMFEHRASLAREGVAAS